MDTALALHSTFRNPKRLCIALAIACLLILLPTVIVVAAGLGIGDSEKLIQRDGVTGSEILITRGDSSWFYIGTGGAHFNPEAPPFQIISLIPLLLVAMGILAILALIAKGIDIETMIIIVVFIYLLISFLTGVQINITNLLR